ncbi:MAG: zeta toxin family protein [Clostridia bacterium]|nr:zeta toxin family protein [Clostridia bacterium]
MFDTELKDINFEVENNVSLCIDNAEKKYMSSVENIADRLETSGAKIVLLAGPSGSGKTTTANILRDYLSSKGHETVVISMDNFYRAINDPLYPRDESGALDYESVYALDTDKIHDCLSGLLCGKAVKIPKYVFGKGVSVPDAIPISLNKGGFVIIEGIHALNPIICDGLDRHRIIKLFISVSTNINDNGKRLISGKKIRFIRRLTRDSLYRGTDAASTLERWSSVLAGENKYLYPYKDTADLKINTFHIYELGLMKKFAQKAIKESERELSGEYIEIVKHALSKFSEVDLEKIPQTSLIREFVPGGKYENLY